MPEHTFAAQVKPQWKHAEGRRDGEFTKIGERLFDSEDLVEALYRIYLPLASHGWIGADQASRIDDIGHLYLHGLYLPCTERVVFSGQVDLRNDELPDYAGLVIFDDGDPFYVGASRVMRARRGIVVPPGCVGYALACFYEQEPEHRRARVAAKVLCPDGEALRYFTRYVAVTPAGAVIPCVYKSAKVSGRNVGVMGLHAQLAAQAMNACADARHLWQVWTGEAVLGRHQTPLRLGVSEEHVKSLFYARQMPVTESGRKRPILHWVRAHRRRIADGIDIDIERHLRGIDRFEMDGFQFEITNPQKSPQKRAA